MLSATPTAAAAAASVIGFCGAGVMARSLMKGILSAEGASGKSSLHRLTTFDPSSEATKIAVGLGVRAVESNAALAKDSDVVFVCTKPGSVPAVCREMNSTLDRSKTIVVSIAAGVSCATIEESFGGDGVRVVRVMPNLPCVVQRMAAGICGGKHATTKDVEFIRTLLLPMGCIVHVPSEESMHAVTGLSGSGPAYVFNMIEALADGGVRAGLTRAAAMELAIHTVRGAAEMLAQSPQTHPGALKDQVCSPGGTTIAGVSVLEKRRTRSAYIEAVTAAANRSKELSKI